MIPVPYRALAHSPTPLHYPLLGLCSVSRRARGVQPVQHTREREATVRGVIRRQRAAACCRVACLTHLGLELARQPGEVGGGRQGKQVASFST